MQHSYNMFGLACGILTAFLIMAENAANNYFAPSVFLNHGGGPNPVLGQKDNLEIAKSLRNISTIVDMKKLKAVIIVTAHREEDMVTISSGNHHDLIYDYDNFPPLSYTYKHNAPGDPELARRIRDAFKNRGIPCRLDEERGWDHGVFIPMMLIDPAAYTPIVQVSILKNQNAEKHYKMGEILYQFRREGVAIFGSGMSYHHMKEFRKAQKHSDGVIVNDNFDEFLNKVCTGERKEKDILMWDKFPQALESHPLNEADHLMPLIVNIGAGGSLPGRNMYKSIFLGKFRLSGFIWDQE